MTYKLKTPKRSAMVKKCVRQSYPAMMKSLLSSKETFEALLSKIEKLIAFELRGMSKLRQASNVMHGKESLLSFSWETIWTELSKCCPILMRLISVLLLASSGKEACNKPVTCFIASIVMKKRYHQLSLVQRAISLLLYGHGSSKQVTIMLSSREKVWKCLHIFCRCTIVCSL